MFSCSLLLTLLSDLTRECMFPLLTLHFLRRLYFLIPHNGKPRRTFFFCFKCVPPPSACLPVCFCLALCHSLCSFPSGVSAFAQIGKLCECFRRATEPRADFGILHKVHDEAFPLSSTPFPLTPSPLSPLYLWPSGAVMLSCCCCCFCCCCK